MKVCRVIGPVVATVKHPKFHAQKMLIVERRSMRTVAMRLALRSSRWTRCKQEKVISFWSCKKAAACGKF